LQDWPAVAIRVVRTLHFNWMPGGELEDDLTGVYVFHGDILFDDISVQTGAL
jgi:hypothetical protein